METMKAVVRRMSDLSHTRHSLSTRHDRLSCMEVRADRVDADKCAAFLALALNTL